jgi:hypothetical protein
MSKRQKIFATKNFQSGAASARLKFFWDLIIGVWDFAGTAMHE